MELKMVSSQIVGLGDTLRWSETSTGDNTLIALEITSDGNFSAIDEGKKYLNGLIGFLKQRSPQDKNTFLLAISQYSDTFSYRDFINSLVVGYYFGTTIFIYCRKSGSVLLKRGDFWSRLLSSEGFISGNLTEKDILVMSTDTFGKILPDEQVISRFYGMSDMAVTAENIGAYLHNLDASKGAAAVFATFEKKESVPVQTITADQVLEISKEQQIQTGTEMSNVQPYTVPQHQEFPDIPVLSSISESDKTALPKVEKPKAPNGIFKFAGFLKNKIIGVSNVFPKIMQRGTASSTVTFSRFSLKMILGTPKKRILGAIIFLSLILVITVFIGKGNISPVKQDVKNGVDLEAITRQIEEGQGLIDLNNLRARTIFSEVIASLGKVKENYKKGTKERIAIEDLLSKATDGYNAVSKIYAVENPPIFLDLTAVKADANSTRLSLYQNTLAVLDNKNISVFTVDIDSKASQIVGGGAKTPNPSLISLLGNNIFILTSDGIVKIDIKQKTQNVIFKEFKDMGVPSFMVAFGGNVYVLDGASKIWKIIPTDKGYLNSGTYLPVDQKVNLSSVNGMAIDSSVWILGPDSINKYTKGVEEEYKIEGLEQPFNRPAGIFTDDKSEYLYILDKGNKRIVVLDKKGLYSSSYVWQGMDSVTDFAVSEAAKKIFLLSGSKIYSIDLK